MARTGKPAHVRADLGDDHPRDRLTDPGHRRQPVGRLAKRLQEVAQAAAKQLRGGRDGTRAGPGLPPAGGVSEPAPA